MSLARARAAIEIAGCLCLCALLVDAADSAKELFDRAVTALSAGDYDKAEQGFQAVLKQEPRNVSALGNLGVVYSRIGRSDQAIEVYRRALEVSPDDEAILLNLGLAYFKQDAHAQALPSFAKVVAIDPGNLQARELLAVCRVYLRDPTPAIQDLEALRASNPNDQNVLFLLGFAYLRSHDAAKAKAIFQLMLEAVGPVQAQFLAGKANFDAGLFPEAASQFQEVLRLAPRFSHAHSELGKAYVSLRRNDDAIRELQLALAEDRSDGDANYYLGSLLVQQGNFEEAVPYLEQATRAKQDDWASFFVLGKALLRLGKPADAVAPLQRAAALNPSDEVSVHYQLGQALKACGRDAEAHRALQKADELRTAAMEAAKVDTSVAGAR